MAIAPADIAVLSRLLDELLELDASARTAWFAALPAEHQRHADALRGMLAEHAQTAAAARLSTLPRLGADEATAQAGERIGPYRLLRPVGQGGMGSVWLAERADGSFERQVALKLPRLAWGAGLAERMARERAIGMRLEHPAIARLYDAGVDERGRPYLALEYIEGQALDAWCQARRLDMRARLRLFVQVVRAVAYAHGRLVVHRDLKPSNVLVSADGQAHLLDFGIAKLLTDAGSDEPNLTLQQGQVLTPHYASPEQIAGEAITVASDIYSLGVLLYQVLSGALPISPKRSTAAALEDAVLQGDAPPASSRVKDRALARALRGDVDAILAKAMKRQPADRYATAEAMAEDIERYLSGEAVKAQPDKLGYRLRKTLLRHRFAFLAVATVLVVAFAGGGVALVQAQRAAAQAQRARLATEFVAEIFRASANPKAADARPSGHGGDPLLGRAGQLIEARFQGQPDMQAELYGVVGRIYADLGASGPATAYARRQIAALDQLPTDPRRHVQARLLLADALEREGHVADAEAQATGAMLAAGSDALLAAEARAFLARIQLQAGKREQARVSAEAAEKVLSAPGVRPTMGLAWALNTKSVLTYDVRQFDKMAALRKQAMNVARQVEGPASPALMTMQIAWAWRLVSLGRETEAAQALDDVLAQLRRQGAAGEARAALEEASYWSDRFYEGGTVPYATVVAIVERSRSVLVRRDALPPEVSAKLDWALGNAHLSHGELDLAGPLLEHAGPILLAATDHPFRQLAITKPLGTYAMLRGRHEQAEAWFRQGMAQRQRDGQATAPWAANDWAILAINLTIQGRSHEARQFLSQAPHFESYNGTPWFSKLVPAVVAMSHVDEGQAAFALTQFPPLDTAEDEDGYSIYAFQASRGAALCSVGRRSDGLALLRSSALTIARREGDLHPGLARVRALAGLCALDQGERQQARQWARLARTSFESQPDVAAYFKAPWLQLEARLRSSDHLRVQAWPRTGPRSGLPAGS